MAPPLELGKGIVGGSLMGVGAAMAGGCNVGGFYTAVSALSLGGLFMMAGLTAGAYLGLRYLYWELEHLPSGSAGSRPKKGPGKGLDWAGLEPYLGAAVFVSALAASWLYSREAYTQLGGLLLCGAGFGLIIQRTRFCFVRCFRDPFMTGEGAMARALSISIFISVLGFAALKWNGLRGEAVYATQAFWLGGLGGGVIFGFGMVLAGGCGSGSVWRAGEGQIKLILAVIFFSLLTSLSKALIRSSDTLTEWMGRGVFLPDHLTYKGSVILLVLLFSATFLLAAWNEETERFTVEM
jgi:uncharacterized membrane protein YedE/YeeE